MLTKYEYAQIILSLVNVIRENLKECRIEKDIVGKRLRNIQDIMDVTERHNYENLIYSTELFIDCPETRDFFTIYTSYIKEKNNDTIHVKISQTPKLDFLLFEEPDRKHVEKLSDEEYDKLIEKIQYGPYSHEELKKKNMDRIATPEHLETWQKLLQKHNLKH